MRTRVALVQSRESMVSSLKPPRGSRGSSLRGVLDIYTERDGDREPDRHRDRNRETDRYRQTDRHRETDRYRQTDRQTENV